MPSVQIKMILNSNSMQLQQNQMQRQILQTTTKTPIQLSLRSPMVGRIYNIKPGCSSCGR